MLIGVPPILGPDFLFTLRAMGHGDELALVDANYPAAEHGRRLVRADGHGIGPLLDAVLQVLPVDDFVETALFRAAVGGDASAPPDPVHEEMERVVRARAPAHRLVALNGPDFYARVREAYAVVATGEGRLYGNIIIRKGVIRPELSRPHP